MLPENRQAGVLSQIKQTLVAREREIAEIVGDWLTSNRAELDDGGGGDVIDLALRILPFGRTL